MSKISYNDFCTTVPTVPAYKAAFLAIEDQLSSNALIMLRAHYNAPNRTLTATEMAELMHYKNHSGANLQYGRLASKVCSQMRIDLEYAVNVLADFVKPEDNDTGQWLWVMWPQVAQALEELGWS